MDLEAEPVYEEIDYLAYSYANNNMSSILTTVTDGANPNHGFSAPGSGYSYDGNGNVTFDGGKGLEIQYNRLNLPRRIQHALDGTVSYSYSLSGEKVQTQVMGTDTYTRTYLGGVEFLDGTAETLYHPEGRIVLDGLHYQYKLSDHLGNTVVLFEDKNQDGKLTTEQDTQDPTDLEVLQRTYYYPFGMPMEGEWNDLSNPKMRYLYNGKELEADLGLDWYAYGARYYDGVIGRFMGVDPLAGKYPSISPYAYVANNPIRYIDPDGREIVIPTSLKGSERRQIMRNLGKLTNDKLSYDKSTGQVTIGKQRTGSKAKGTELISRVINSSNTMTITVGAKGSGNSESDVNSANAINGVGSDVNVSFDPTSNPDILTVDPKTGNVSGKKRPNQIGLGHEIIHGERSMRGEAIDYSDMGTHTYQDENGNTVTQTVPKEELGTVGLKHNTSKDITENDLRKEQSKTKNKQRGAY